MLLNAAQKLLRQHSRFSGISMIFSLLSRDVLFSSPLFLLERMMPICYSQVQGELENTAIQLSQLYFRILGEDRNKSRYRENKGLFVQAE